MIRQQIKDSIEVKEAILNSDEHIKTLEDIIEAVYSCLSSGNKVLIAGNGGSAAHSQHFAAEFVGKYDKLERKGYPVLSLTTDTSMITAWSNDYEFDTVFKRQVEAHGRSGDTLIVVSTSGNSGNLIEAINEAKKIGMKTVSILGKGGGKMKGMADAEFIAPSDSTPRVQDAHTLIVHLVSEEVERMLVEDEK